MMYQKKLLDLLDSIYEGFDKDIIDLPDIIKFTEEAETFVNRKNVRRKIYFGLQITRFATVLLEIYADTYSPSDVQETISEVIPTLIQIIVLHLSNQRTTFLLYWNNGLKQIYANLHEYSFSWAVDSINTIENKRGWIPVKS